MSQKKIKNLTSTFQTWYGLLDVDSALLLAPHYVVGRHHGGGNHHCVVGPNQFLGA